MDMSTTSQENLLVKEQRRTDLATLVDPPTTTPALQPRRPIQMHLKMTNILQDQHQASHLVLRATHPGLTKVIPVLPVKDPKPATQDLAHLTQDPVHLIQGKLQAHRQDTQAQATIKGKDKTILGRLGKDLLDLAPVDTTALTQTHQVLGLVDQASLDQLPDLETIHWVKDQVQVEDPVSPDKVSVAKIQGLMRTAIILLYPESLMLTTLSSPKFQRLRSDVTLNNILDTTPT
jgi:hypothetical protein